MLCKCWFCVCKKIMVDFFAFDMFLSISCKFYVTCYIPIESWEYGLSNGINIIL
jgi:hypothetical protein